MLCNEYLAPLWDPYLKNRTVELRTLYWASALFRLWLDKGIIKNGTTFNHLNTGCGLVPNSDPNCFLKWQPCHLPVMIFCYNSMILSRYYYKTSYNASGGKKKKSLTLYIFFNKFSHTINK